MNNKKDVQIKITSYPKETPMMINFVKEGQPVPHKEKIHKIYFRLRKRMGRNSRPEEETCLPKCHPTTLRPDIVLSSHSDD